MRVGREVRKARKELGLRPAEFARQTGLSQQLLWNLENDRRMDPRLSTVLALVFRGGMKLTPEGLKAA